MTIQVPLMQKQPPTSGFAYGCDDLYGSPGQGFIDFGSPGFIDDNACECESTPEIYNPMLKAKPRMTLRTKSKKKTPVFGSSSAARVSRGSRVDTWNGLTVKEPKRHSNEHITVTIVLYYTCSGGVPT